jgi:DNA transformation protein and related proteins
MAKISDYVVYLLEQLSGFGEVEAKSMFGGYGLYHEGLMFGLVADDMVYFKVDAESESEFVNLGLEPFLYEKNGKQMKMSYYQPPATATDDAVELCEWARKADAAAKRAAAKKGKKKRAKKKFEC